MKKYLLNWMAILMVAIVSVSLLSCDDDDDDKKENEVSLVGTWEKEYYDTHDKEYCLMRWTFNANGTGLYLELWDKDEKGEYKNVEANDEFTYKFDRNSMTLQIVWLEDGENVAIKIESLTDNLLIISNVYTDEENHPQGKLTKKEVFKKKW